MRTSFIVNTVILLFTLSVSLHAQTKRALVIGLGQQADPAWNKINGDKDVPLVEQMLKSAGFNAKNINKLVNHQATKAAVLRAFARLAQQAKPNDVIYVHFSGHGQQMRDLHNDEPDGLDECWITYDAYLHPCNQDRGEKHLTDDEVNACLNAIRNKVGNGGKMLVVVDACHSGDATRGDATTDGPERGVSEVFEALKAYIFGSPDTDEQTEVNPRARVRAERWITLSACRSNEVNLEMKSPAAGKLTYALFKNFKRMASADNNELMRQIRKFINSNTHSRPQQPVISGETNRYNISDILQ